jgi:hypothetical protein
MFVFHGGALLSVLRGAARLGIVIRCSIFRLSAPSALLIVLTCHTLDAAVQVAAIAADLDASLRQLVGLPVHEDEALVAVGQRASAEVVK